MQVRDDESGAVFRLWTLYPTPSAPAQVAFGPYTVEASADAPIEPATFPLVVVSHGSGSSPFLFRDLAARLVRHGHVVAVVEHPGDHRNDRSRSDTDENLVARPRHVRRAIDAVLADGELGPHVRSDRVAVIGHSLGAYTALAVAGGTPWSKAGEPLAVAWDPRIGALVLLAPAAYGYVPDGSLARVTAPMLVYTGAADTITPPWHGHLVASAASAASAASFGGQVPDTSKVIHHVVEHAGHLSFLSELPPSSGWRDPPGFDRAGFHERLGSEVCAFLGRALGAMTHGGALAR